MLHAFLQASPAWDLIQNNNITYQNLKEKSSIVNERLDEQRALLLRNSFQLFPLYGHPFLLPLPYNISKTSISYK